MFLHISQVIPDHRATKKLGAPIQDANRAAWVATCARILQQHLDTEGAEAEGLGQRARGKNKTLISNQLWQKALDHAVQSLGLSLAYFMPQRRPVALTGSQSRYFTLLPAGHGRAQQEEELPADVVRRRACVADSLTGKRWLELPDTPVPRRHHIM
jgi:hypothetical protein